MLGGVETDPGPAVEDRGEGGYRAPGPHRGETAIERLDVRRCREPERREDRRFERDHGLGRRERVAHFGSNDDAHPYTHASAPEPRTTFAAAR